jgi:hypothetical protein
MYKWGMEWLKPDLTSEQRDVLTKTLLRAAIGIEEGGSRTWWYSFCRETWQQDMCTSHCVIYWECNDWRYVHSQLSLLFIWTWVPGFQAFEFLLTILEGAVLI